MDKSDKWLAPFRSGQICYDKYAKEFVRISNGRCTLDHSSPEAFAESHKDSGCRYAPSEAVALRVVSMTKSRDPIIAYTYRGVDPAQLEPARDGCMIDHTHIRPSRFAGRV